MLSQTKPVKKLSRGRPNASANGHQRVLAEMYLEGPADLVVEVISPGSVSVDRVEKYGEYERGGVKEYWLIHPERKRADFYRRERTGTFQQLPVDEEGIVRSVVLKGVWLKMDWLWKRPLPDAMSVLRQWKLV